MVLVVAGMIGLGKSSLAEILGEHYDSEVFYEEVNNNPVLELFYTASEQEKKEKRYSFLLQLAFLNSRFRSIKRALYNDKNILDRSIYEDEYFAHNLYKLGDISGLEFDIYRGLLYNMMEELKELPKKNPDLLIYLKGSFEVVMEHINKRGRDFEINDDLRDYYYSLWKDYDSWVENQYNASQVLVIDMDKYDFVNNHRDREEVLQIIDNKLDEMGLL